MGYVIRLCAMNPAVRLQNALPLTADLTFKTFTAISTAAVITADGAVTLGHAGQTLALLAYLALCAGATLTTTAVVTTSLAIARGLAAGAATIHGVCAAWIRSTRHGVRVAPGTVIELSRL